MAYSASNPFTMNPTSSLTGLDWDAMSANNYNNPTYNAFMSGGSGFGSSVPASPGDAGVNPPAPASIPKSLPTSLGNYAPAGSSGSNTILSGGLDFSNKPGSPLYNAGLNGNWSDLFSQGSANTGFRSNDTSFDPWAGNPYAAGMANNIVNGFLQNGQIAGQTSNAIWQTMQQQMGSNFQYEQARVQANLMQDKLANDKAAVDAQLALAQGSQSLEAQKLAAQLKMASDQLAAQIEQNKQQMALSNAQLAQQGQLGNKSLDTQAAQAAAAQAFQQQQLAQQAQLGNKQLDIQSQQGGSAQAQLDFQKWQVQQQIAQQNSDRDQKNSLLALIMQNMGGGGGGMGSGGGTGGSGGGTGGIGFTGPQGQYANMNINTGITAGALNPAAIRNSVSAIEGAPSGGAMAGSRGGMTGAQQKALSQDMGAMNYAGGQAAGNEALRKFLPANAQLDLASNNAKNGMALGYGQFLAEAERGRAGQQQNKSNLMIQLLNSL